MSRSISGSKGCGFDYNGKRAGNKNYANGYIGRITKKHTLGVERMQARNTLVNELSSSNCLDY